MLPRSIEAEMGQEPGFPPNPVQSTPLGAWAEWRKDPFSPLTATPEGRPRPGLKPELAQAFQS